MNTTGAVRMTRTKLAVAAAALMGLVLTGCSGGSDLKGEYFSEEGQLIIDGSSVVFYKFGCPANSPKSGDKALIEKEPSAEGQITDDSTQVIWNSDDRTSTAIASAGRHRSASARQAIQG